MRQFDAIVAHEQADRILCTGDVFDAWGDSPDDIRQAAEWLKPKLHNPKYLFLMGNHDVGARWWPENQWAFCSGATEEKSAAVRRVLTEEDWSKTQISFCLPAWNLLFSHAGIDERLPALLAQAGEPPPASYSARSLHQWLTTMWPGVVERYHAGRIHWLLEAGQSRGGTQRIGGVTWEDFRSHNPIKGMGQVVGHTTHNEPLFRFWQGVDSLAPMWRAASKTRTRNPGGLTRELTGGWSLCIDTNLHHYLRIDTQTGRAEIKAVTWDSRGVMRADPTVLCAMNLPRFDVEAEQYQLAAPEPATASLKPSSPSS